MNTPSPASVHAASSSAKSNAQPCCGDGCCTPETPPDIRDTVRAGYGQIAQIGVWTDPAKLTSCCQPSGANVSAGGCCGGSTLTPDQVAHAVGYAGDELAALPDGANMGLSCGNPTAIAALKPGEVVLDLGAGGGLDCFLAGPKVGPAGRVVGVDMTADMLKKARLNLAAYQAHTGLNNVEFRLGEIENLPVADSSVDVVLSNCVLNLSPDKARVWREIARVLKPGGRVAISDLCLLKPLPPQVAAMVEALVGCVAGAVLVEDVRAMAAAAGLEEIGIVCKSDYIDAMTNGGDPLYQRILAALPPGSSIGQYVTSADISARKRQIG